MTSDYKVRLRPLEREDLRFVHQLDNNASVMRYWFEEPYEAFVELSDLYDKHIHDQSERRFVVECDGENAGLVELVEINHVHRRAEFQIIISPEYQGKGLASRAAKLAMDYGFTVLNLYKLYLIASLTIVERCVYPPKSRRVFCRASARWVRAHGIMRIWLAIKLTTAPASIRSRRCVLPPWQKGILNIQIWWKSKKSKPPAPGRFYAPGAPRFANTTTFKTLFWMSIVSCYENHQP